MTFLGRSRSRTRSRGATPPQISTACCTWNRKACSLQRPAASASGSPPRRRTASLRTSGRASSTRVGGGEGVGRGAVKLGFRREFENHRYEGSQEGRVSPGVRLMRDDDLDALPDLDRTYFGADRGRLLRRLFSEFPSTSLVVDDGGGPAAFGFGKTSGAPCEVGPFVCPPGRAVDADNLLHAMFREADRRCAFSLPAVNEAGVAAARGGGGRGRVRPRRA